MGHVLGRSRLAHKHGQSKSNRVRVSSMGCVRECTYGMCIFPKEENRKCHVASEARLREVCRGAQGSRGARGSGGRGRGSNRASRTCLQKSCLSAMPHLLSLLIPTNRTSPHTRHSCTTFPSVSKEGPTLIPSVRIGPLSTATLSFVRLFFSQST